MSNYNNKLSLGTRIMSDLRKKLCLLFSVISTHFWYQKKNDNYNFNVFYLFVCENKYQTLGL